MGFSKYDSEAGMVGNICPTCSRENEIPVSEIRAYALVGSGGVAMVLPPCACCSLTLLSTGVDIGSPGGHALNCLAAAVVSKKQYFEGSLPTPAPKELSRQIENLRSRYAADDSRLLQMEQVTPIFWKKPRPAKPDQKKERNKNV